MTELRQIFEAGVASVRPEQRIRDVVKIKDNKLLINDDIVSLEGNNGFHVVGFGKAVLGMAFALESLLGDKINSGVISVPVSEEGRPPLKVIKTIYGARNNLPDQDSLFAASEIKKLVKNLKPGSVLFILISGGGSALLPCPLPPLTLDDKSRVISSLSKAGATIFELNSVRKRLSGLKGGKFVGLNRKIRMITLILSDVIGDPLDIIASGPSVPNTDPPERAKEILEKYGISVDIPEEEIPVSRDEFDHVTNIVIGNNELAINACLESAKERGFSVSKLGTGISGDARNVGSVFAALAFAICYVSVDPIADSEIYFLLTKFSADSEVYTEILERVEGLRSSKRPVCIIGGGETTVKIPEDCSGKGGRNQEMTLAFAVTFNDLCSENKKLGTLPDLRDYFDVKFLSGGTDGIDGPTDAAGAWADGFTATSDASSYLSNHDSYNFFVDFNDGSNHIKIGHTGTNVMDIHILSISPKEKL